MPMADARYTLVLDGLSLTMGLGIHDHEQTPQRVLVDVRVECLYPDAPAEDRIDEALDYDVLYHGIRALAASRHFSLQETLCEEIAALCLADPRAERVTVRTCKPDIFPDARVGCEVVRAR